MRRVALIPARGGSKRIPGKNIRSFHGVPAIGRVIKGIASVGLFDEILVSTDSSNVAEVALSYGASVVPRPSESAGDYTGLLEVVQRDLATSAKHLVSHDIVACVLPTAVLMDTRDLATAVKLVSDGAKPFVVAVGRFSYPIQRALKIAANGELEMLQPANYPMRSQDLEVYFHDAGQFYVGTCLEWKHRKTMFDKPVSAVEIDDLRLVDIDVESDWLHAEALWSHIQTGTD